MIRKPISIKRVPISYLTESNNRKLGGRFLYDNPDGHPSLSEAVTRRVSRIRTLWCPVCGDHKKFVVTTDDRELWKCSGCSIPTNDFYVRFTNNLWWEGVPFAKVKELSSIRFTK